MPIGRTGFTLNNVDESKIFVVGNDFCDVYDIEKNLWSSVRVPFSPTGDQQVSRYFYLFMWLNLARESYVRITHELFFV
jgi:hypothetical protein